MLLAQCRKHTGRVAFGKDLSWPFLDNRFTHPVDLMSLVLAGRSHTYPTGMLRTRGACAARMFRPRARVPHRSRRIGLPQQRHISSSLCGISGPVRQFHQFNSYL
jgi:hypothetical protein